MIKREDLVIYGLLALGIAMIVIGVVGLALSSDLMPEDAAWLFILLPWLTH